MQAAWGRLAAQRAGCGVLPMLAQRLEAGAVHQGGCGGLPPTASSHALRAISQCTPPAQGLGKAQGIQAGEAPPYILSCLMRTLPIRSSGAPKHT